MIRAAIFDLDGTLVDSGENYYQADRILLARRGVVHTREDHARLFGLGTLELVGLLAQRHGLPEPSDALCAEKNRIYLGLAESHTPVFPEMKRFWDLLRSARMPLAIASGSSPAVLARVIEVIGLARDVSVVVSAEEVPRGKPAPDIFLEAARKLAVPARECVVVEDSLHGVESALRAGMCCIAVPQQPTPPRSEAFSAADLLFPGGMATFDAERAHRWIKERGASAQAP